MTLPRRVVTVKWKCNANVALEECAHISQWSESLEYNRGESAKGVQGDIWEDLGDLARGGAGIRATDTQGM